MKTADPMDPVVAGGRICSQAPGHRPGVWAAHEDRRHELHRLEPVDVRRLVLEGSGLLLLTVVVAAIAAPFGYAWLAFCISFVFGAGGLIARHRDDEWREFSEEILAMSDEFGVGPSWTVDVMIRQGEAPTGRDQGLMWVEGGRVLFSGRCTSFAISPDQAASPIRHEYAVRGLRLRLNLELKAETEAGKVTLSFWPLADGFRRAEEDAASMRYAFNSILVGPGRPSTIGQWPPLEVGPGALTPSQALRSLRTRTFLWAVGVVIFSIPTLIAFPALGVGEFVLLIGLAFALNKNDFAMRNRAYQAARRAWR